MLETRRVRAVIELLIAAGFWGFGFVATKWALEVLNTPELVFVRFAIGIAVGVPFVLAAREHSVAKKVRLSFLPAVLLMGTLLFQTWGLLYTTPTKCGFITTLYVVFVPLLEAIILKRRIPLGIWACVAGALIGTGLIVDIGFSEINLGDVLTFISALIATGQIYYMGTVSPKIKYAFVFNIYQCLWCMIMILPFVRWSELATKLHGVGEWSGTAVVGITTLAVGSTVFAFYLQIRAQKDLSRTVSSLLCLLESPFAMIFSMILLSQTLNFTESLGALLIFVSAFFATWFEAQPAKSV